MNTSATSGAKPLWRSVIFLTFLSGLTGSLMYFGDGYMASYVMFTKSWAGTLAYFLTGAWIGILVNYALAWKFGNKLSNSNARNQGMGLVSMRYQWFAAQAGIFAGISTFAYIYVLRGGDAVVVVALSSVVAFFTLYFDGKAKRPPIASTSVSILIVSVGIGLVVANNRMGWNIFSNITWQTIAVMIIGSCFTAALSRRAEGKATSEYGEGNFAFWRFFWLLVFATIGVTVCVRLFGIQEEFWNVLLTKGWQAAIWSVPIATLAYLSNVFRMMGQTTENLTNTAIMQLSWQILLTMLLTLLFAYTVPGGIFAIPTDPVVLGQRVAGAMLIVLAVGNVIRWSNRR